MYKISSSGMMSLFNRKHQISYNRSSLDKAANLLRSLDHKFENAEKEPTRALTAEEIPEAEYVEEVNLDRLKKGVTYYVINPGPEGKKGNPVNLPGVDRHYAFVRLSTVLEKVEGVTKVNGVKVNIYNDDGELINSEIGSSKFTGFEVVITEYIIPSTCIFLDADKLLSAPQGGGNKRKKHSSNKLSKRRVKTKSRRRNNLSHRRKQQR